MASWETPKLRREFLKMWHLVGADGRKILNADAKFRGEINLVLLSLLAKKAIAERKKLVLTLAKTA